MFPALCLLLCLLLSGCGGGTTTEHANIRGRVVDASFAPLSLASVSMGGQETTTNANGIYTLSALPTGTQTLHVSLAGYLTHEAQFVLPKGSTYLSQVVLTQKASQTTPVDGEGGTALSPDGSGSVDIAAGALTTEQNISVTVADLASAPAPPPSGFVLVYLLYLSPEVSLADGGTIAITTGRPTVVDRGSTVTFYHYNTTTKAWESVGATTAGENTISGTVTSLGWIGLMIPLTTGTVTGTVQTTEGATLPYADVWVVGKAARGGADGTFSLSGLTPGEVTLHVLAEGYQEATQAVTITSGGTSQVSIALLAQPTGTLQGTVRNTQTSIPLSGARVTLSEGGTAITDTNGFYQFSDIAVGSYTVQAFLSGYTASSPTTVDLTTGSTLTQNLALTQSSAPTAISETGENGTSSWTASTFTDGVGWQLLTNPETVTNTLHPTYVILPGGNTSLPSADGGSHAWWFGQTTTGSYLGAQDSTDQANSGGTSQAPHTGTLTSPEINLATFSHARLTFATWWEVEGVNPATGFDSMKVEISTDNGSNWETLAILNPSGDPDPTNKESHIPYSSAGYNQAPIWVQHNYDITPYVGASQAFIRFAFDTSDTQNNGFRGWLLDNIVIDDRELSTSSLSVTGTPAWIQRPTPRRRYH